MFGLLLMALAGGVAFLNLDRVINYIAQILVDASKMEIEQIMISSCDDKGFLFSLTTKIYDTGPLPATITDMNLYMYSTSSADAKAFAKISLPPIHASPSGTVCRVSDQRVEILDFAAFHTFNKNLLLQEELPTYIRGTGKLNLPWPFGFLSTVVKYEKVEMLKGLDGVHTSVLETRKASRSLLKGKPTAIEVDVSIVSESPVAVDMGPVKVSIVFSGVQIATVQSDSMVLKKGDNRITMNGSMDFVSISKNVGAGLKFLKKDVLDNEAEAYVKGVEGKQCVWLDQTVKMMNSKIQMGSTMADLVRSVYTAEGAA
ncbi:hypothetical protein N0V93_010033 [Gnomoniopsis smithogilvyi]|uniref:Uncharacterized protein n=1 Tax=Gnomoniopsis smithogilvyi TaxID=1191159 RepID=A0A9W8YJK5_9PEZI|nr:hypothetical protein N0V93_010033 [Gnomoniopsis smithogilvyi]